MSKNFELMQRIERERQVPSVPASPEVPSFIPPFEEVAADPVLPATDPCSSLGQLRRNELLKLVHRLFSTASEFSLAVVFAAVEPDGGSAHIVASVAQLLAQHSGGKVCIVDANLRAPHIHEAFAIPNSTGWSDALSEGGPIRQFTRRVRENLWVSPAGALRRNSRGEFSFTLDSAKPRLLELRASFDYLLFSAGNVAREPEALLWAKLADGTVLVVEANATRRDSAGHSRQALRAANIPLLGAVLNNREFPIPRAIYNRL